MIVKQEQNGYRIVDDAPYSLQLDGVGLYAIEKHEGAADDGWWRQVYPKSFKCTSDLSEVERVFNELTK